MKIKKEYIILAGAIVVLSLYLVLHKTDETNYKLPEIPDVDKKDISRVVITKKGSVVELTGKDGAWVIAPQGYPADSNKVDAMLSTLDSLMLTDMITDKGTSENYERYELDDDKKISISAFDGDTLKLAFDMGKTAPSHRHMFVKLKDDPAVYYAKDNFRSKFDISLENLRDKKVLAFDKDEITGISIAESGKTTAYRKNAIPVEVTPKPEKEGEEPEKAPAPETRMVWQDKDGKEADPGKINRLMSSLAGLRCENFMEDDKKASLKDPIYTVTFTGNEDYILSVYAKEDPDAAKYPVTSSKSDYAFYLNTSTANDFMKIFKEEKKEEKKAEKKKPVSKKS